MDINESLREFIKSNPDPRELKRALATQMSLEGYTHSQIIKTLNVSSGFISKWKNVFVSQGIEGLKLRYQGGDGFLTPEQRQEIIDWLKAKNYWNLGELEYHLANSYGVIFKSKQSYYDLFEAAGISWKKSQKKNPSADPAQVEATKKEIIAVLENRRTEIESGELAVFLIDECHLLWGDACGYLWGKTSERAEVPMRNERERQTYFGAIDYQMKEFLVQAYETANSEKTSEFLKYLRSQRPGQKIFVI